MKFCKIRPLTYSKRNRVVAVGAVAANVTVGADVTVGAVRGLVEAVGYEGGLGAGVAAGGLGRGRLGPFGGGLAARATF